MRTRQLAGRLFFCSFTAEILLARPAAVPGCVDSGTSVRVTCSCRGALGMQEGSEFPVTTCHGVLLQPAAEGRSRLPCLCYPRKTQDQDRDLNRGNFPRRLRWASRGGLTSIKFEPVMTTSALGPPSRVTAPDVLPEPAPDPHESVDFFRDDAPSRDAPRSSVTPSALTRKFRRIGGSNGWMSGDVRADRWGCGG